MLRDAIIEHATALKNEFNCENVFITGDCAMVCTGLLIRAQSYSPVFLEMPAICHRLFGAHLTETLTARFGSTLCVMNRTGVRVLPPETSIADHGCFVNLGNGLWAESLESHLGNSDPLLIDAIRAHLNSTYTE